MDELKTLPTTNTNKQTTTLVMKEQLHWARHWKQTQHSNYWTWEVSKKKARENGWYGDFANNQHQQADTKFGTEGERALGEALKSNTSLTSWVMWNWNGEQGQITLIDNITHKHRCTPFSFLQVIVGTFQAILWPFLRNYWWPCLGPTDLAVRFHVGSGKASLLLRSMSYCCFKTTLLQKMREEAPVLIKWKRHRCQKPIVVAKNAMFVAVDCALFWCQLLVFYCPCLMLFCCWNGVLLPWLFRCCCMHSQGWCR